MEKPIMRANGWIDINHEKLIVEDWHEGDDRDKRTWEEGDWDGEMKRRKQSGKWKNGERIDELDLPMQKDMDIRKIKQLKNIEIEKAIRRHCQCTTEGKYGMMKKEKIYGWRR